MDSFSLESLQQLVDDFTSMIHHLSHTNSSIKWDSQAVANLTSFINRFTQDSPVSSFDQEVVSSIPQLWKSIRLVEGGTQAMV